MEKVKIGIIGGSGLYDMPGLTERKEVAIETPFGNPSDQFHHRDSFGRTRRLSGPARQGASTHALGAQFSRQYLCLQASWSRAHFVGQRGRFLKRGDRASGHRFAGSVRGSDARTDLKFLRQRPRSAYCLRRSGVSRSSGAGPQRFRQGGHHRPKREAPIFAWKGRPFRPGRNPNSIAAGAWTSSA